MVISLQSAFLSIFKIFRISTPVFAFSVFLSRIIVPKNVGKLDIEEWDPLTLENRPIKENDKWDREWIMVKIFLFFYTFFTVAK